MIAADKGKVQARFFHAEELFYSNGKFLVGRIGAAFLHPLPNGSPLRDVAQAKDMGNLFTLGVIDDVIIHLYKGIVFGIFVNIIAVFVLDLLRIVALKHQLIGIMGHQLLGIADDGKRIVIIGGVGNTARYPQAVGRAGGYGALENTEDRRKQENGGQDQKQASFHDFPSRKVSVLPFHYIAVFR